MIFLAGGLVSPRFEKKITDLYHSNMENVVMLTASLVKKLSPISLSVKEGDFETVILNTIDRFKIGKKTVENPAFPFFIRSCRQVRMVS